MPNSISNNRAESPFDKIRHVDDNGEHWFARELQPILGYKTWREFNDIIEKAKISCQNSSQMPSDHFVLNYKMVTIGSKTQRKVEDYRLTRHACYLTAMNGNPRIEAISLAQAYFAQVLLPGTDTWQDFVHPRRAGARYHDSVEHMVHRDVHSIYPDAEQQGEA